MWQLFLFRTICQRFLHSARPPLLVFLWSLVIMKEKIIENISIPGAYYITRLCGGAAVSRVVYRFKRSKSMRDSEVAEKAEEFCTAQKITTSPVEIVKICNHMGLQVFEEYMEPGTSGLIVVDEQEWVKYGTNQFIVVNLAEAATRRRFTIAHELAHFVLHRNGELLFAHRDTQGSDVCLKSENEANYFASIVLMPEQLVMERVTEISNGAWRELPDFILVKETAGFFAVSESAARVRLKHLGII